jgi:biotin transport system substrate-specific component
MSGTKVLEGFFQKRIALFQWTRQTSLIMKIGMALGMACITGILAQVRFYLPWSPVPVVASQFGVIMSAVFLGRRWGGISMIIYALIGLAGIPWFAGMKGGAAFLLGPTSGYIAGFILASFFIGYFVDRYKETRKTLPLIGIILVSQLVIVYIPGLIQLGIYMRFVKGQAVSLIQLLWMGFIPFIAGDIFKSIACSMVSRVFLPAGRDSSQ